MSKPKFELGQLVMTPGVIDACNKSDDPIGNYFARHVSGDWGDVCKEDAKENDYSVTNGLRIFSAYHLSDGTKIWVITECDRSATTALLPSEY